MLSDLQVSSGPTGTSRGKLDTADAETLDTRVPLVSYQRHCLSKQRDHYPGAEKVSILG